MSALATTICGALTALVLAMAGMFFLPATPGGATAAQEPFSALAAPIGVLQGPPSLTGADIDEILAGYGSPAMGSGQDFYDLGLQYGIDPAYALAFFVEESSAGTDPRWDGLKPDGSTTHDIGNISCGGGFPCYGRWRDYPDWRTGIDDWFRLIRTEYIEQRGHTTVDQVIPVYAPAFENDVGGYTNTVSALVGKWRDEYGMEGTQVAYAPRVSSKCGYTDTMTVGENSSFYSTGAPAWSGQYDGYHLGADMVGNAGDPVYAPWGMTIDSVGRYDDPGRYGAFIQAHIVSDGYLFYAGHLIDVYVQAGERVSACTVIGTLGATSQPHVHIKLAGPSAPIPCEGSPPGLGGCLDPLEYWETH